MFTNSSRGYIGVDLGAGAIKVAQVARRRSAYELIDAAIVSRQSVGGNQSAADEIRGGLSIAERIAGKSAAAVLGMQVCDFQAMELAGSLKTPDSVRTELLRRDRRYWGNRTLDSWPLPQQDAHSNGQPNVGVVSVSTGIAAQAVKDLSAAGLDCQQLDVAPTAIARAVGLMLEDPSATVGVLDWGHTTTSYYAVQNSQPIFSRTFKQSGFAEAIQLVAEMIGCSLDEASRVIQNRGVAGNEASRRDGVNKLIEKAAEPTLQRMLKELSRTLRYFETHKRMLKPSAIILLGEGATTPHIESWLSRQLAVDVKTWRPHHDRLRLPADLATPPALIASAIAASTLRWEAS